MSAVSAHWFHLTGRGFDLPVAIFDLDGVLSDASHRQHHLAADPPDWDGFGRLAHLDPPLIAGRAAVDELRDDHLITVVTARPADQHDVTVGWFSRHDIHVDVVAYRPTHDRRPSQDVKRDVLDRILSLGGDVKVVYEDDMDNVRMYEAAGLHVVYVHSGYYDQGKAQP